jgi:hypothetical protein
VDLCPRRGNSAGLGFSVPPGAVLLVGISASGHGSGCLATLISLILSCEEGSKAQAFALVVGN